jgi:hypothetical protein
MKALRDANPPQQARLRRVPRALRGTENADHRDAASATHRTKRPRTASPIDQRVRRGRRCHCSRGGRRQPDPGRRIPENAYAAAHNALAATASQRSGTVALTINGTTLYTERGTISMCGDNNVVGRRSGRPPLEIRRAISTGHRSRRICGAFPYRHLTPAGRTRSTPSTSERRCGSSGPRPPGAVVSGS